MLLAIDRRSEVSDVVFRRRIRPTQSNAFAACSGVSNIEVEEILNMQWRRLTRADRQVLQDWLRS
jgi:hypothetical protein